MKLQSFKDLKAWHEGNKLVLDVYQITRKFPTQEQFGLTNQLRRAAVSVTSNIAEGFSRRGLKEKSQFYYMSLGSLSEVHNQLIISYQVDYLHKQEFDSFEKQIELVSKLINGLIRSTQNR